MQKHLAKSTEKAWRKNSRPIAFAVLSILVLLVSIQFLLNYSRRTEPLQDAAGNFLQGIIDGDAAMVQKYMWPEELKMNDLSQEDIQLILDELMIPRIKSLKIDKQKMSKATYTGQGFAYVVLDKSGNDTAFGVSAYRVNGKPHGMLSAVLVLLWTSEELISTGQPITRELMQRAILTGVKKDQDILRQAGFIHLFEASPGSGTVKNSSIDEYIKRLEYWATHPEPE